VRYFEQLGDANKAVKWYKKAAERGHALAQNNLAMLLVSGEGIEHNLKAAASWFQRAAEQGLPQAEAQLGMMLLEGMGGPPDKKSGAMWLMISARQGAMSQIAVQKYLAVLTDAESRESKARADQWIHDHEASLPEYQEQVQVLSESLHGDEHSAKLEAH
jgi:TPR repeat protein